MEIIDSMQFVFVNEARNRFGTPSRATVNISSSPSTQRPGSVGMVPLELGGEIPASPSPLGRVGLREAIARRLSIAFTVIDGQVADHVSALVQGATLDQGPVAEHLDHRRA